MKISFSILVFAVFANCVNARNMRKEIQKVINDKNAIVGIYVTNDIGIIRLSDKDVIYAIFIMDSQESKETNYKIISDIGKIIYDYQYGKNRN